jgi:hypothetical protein
MRLRALHVLVAGLSLGWVPAAAQKPAELQRFAGTWEAKFKGAVICTITLEAAEKITGTTSGCNINVDDDGNLIDPEAAQDPAEPAPILNPKVEGGTLTFEIRDEDDEHPTKIQIELKGEGQAELRIIDAHVKIKPIPLTKR